MAHSGLEASIRAAGGVTDLARRVGESQPSISSWSRIPAERVLAVEAAPGIARTIPRPDLHAAAVQPDDAEAARAQEVRRRSGGGDGSPCLPSGWHDRTAFHRNRNQAFALPG